MKAKTIAVISLCVLIISCETLKSTVDNVSSVFRKMESNNSQEDAAGFDPNQRAIQDTENWDVAILDTAANVDYLTGIEKDVILEMNKVRANPKQYAELYLQPRLKYYNGNNYSVPGQITIETNEGISAVNICISALNTANNVGVLTPDLGLSLSARDHIIDQTKTGEVGHYGSDGSTPEIRMKRHGTFDRTFTLAENITYGTATGRDIVCQLLIDDGVPDRGHRIIILNREFTQTGIAFGTHPEYRTACTVTYANGYNSTLQP